MNTSLPIYPCREEILAAIKENDTTIITAETGSGKSTQVPQYLYEAGYNVICTQPRRIACVTLAERVSKEMDSTVVGYQTAFESTRTEDTKILFCTDGLKLAQGIRDTSSVLVIDEIHEWNLNIETLVAWVRKHREDGGHIKVVLMSATVDASPLLKFYKDGKVGHVNAPGRTFEVKKEFISSYRDPKDPQSEYIKKIKDCVDARKNVLAFRPGKKEIADTIKALELVLGSRAVILPMHGELPLAEQDKCFKNYSKPKVIVATNIAQTSITIPDIRAVVDDGVEKHVVVEDGIENLVPHHISKADIEQRAGRAGRVTKGDYYLCSECNIEKREDYSIAEINRLLLDKVVLKLFSVKIDAAEIKFFHQPDKESVQEAKDLLRMLGAIDNDGITDLGRRLISYPLSVRSSMIIEAAREYGMVDDVLKIVAILECHSLVNFRPMNKDDREYRYANFTDETRSDLIAELKIFEENADTPINFLPDGINRKSFARISEIYKKLRKDIEDTETEISAERDGNWYKNLLHCLYKGFPDRIFKNRWGDYQGVNGTFKFSRYSCARQSSDLVIAVPRNITFKNKWGELCSLSVIDKISSIPDAWFDDIIDMSKAKWETDENPWYDKGEKKFICEDRLMYLGALCLKRRERQIGKDDPDFEEVKEKYESMYGPIPEETKADLIEEKVENLFREAASGIGLGHLLAQASRSFEAPRPTEIEYEIGDKKYQASRSWRWKGYQITFWSLDDFPAKEFFRETFLDPYGEPINFCCGNFSSTNLSYVYSQILAGKISRLNAEARKRKQVQVKNLDDFLEKHVSMLGVFTIYDDTGQTQEKWYGLSYNYEKNTVRSLHYASETEYQKETDKGFKRLFEMWVHENCPTSGFAFEKHGKQITNKSTEEQKTVFRDYVKDIVADVTFENLKENQDFVRQVYEECIGNMEENPW